MAITEGTQPAVVTWTDAWTTPGKTTASFTPEAGALLVALGSGDGSAAGCTGSVTDSLGGSWTLLKRQNANVGTVNGACEVWVRDSPGAALTVTWTNTANGSTGGQLVVRTLLGAKAAASQNGATNGTTLDPGAIQVSVTAGTGNKIYGAAFNFSNSTVMTPLGNTSVINAFSDTTNGDTWEAFKSSGDTAGTATYGYSTSTSGMIAAVEILAALVGGFAELTPDTFLSDATLLDIADDTGDPALGFLYRAPDYSPLAPLGFPLPNLGPVRPRLRMIKRSEMAVPIFIQAAAPAAPNFLQDPGRHWLRGVAPRRGRITRPVDPQSAPPPPTPDRPSLRPRLWRRTRLAAVTPDQAQPQPLARARRTGVWRRRPQAPMPVPPQVSAAAPPAYPWQALGQRRRGAWRRRPQAPSPVPAQQAAPIAPPYVPQLKVARRVQAAPRRGRAAVPTPTVQPVPVAVTRRRFTLPGKRRQLTTPVPPQIVVIPPVYPKQPVRRRIIALLLRRPGRLRTPVPPQVGPPPVIDANGRVVVTQTVVSGVDASSAPSSQAGVDQSIASTAFGSSPTDGRTSVDPTSDGRAEVG